VIAFYEKALNDRDVETAFRLYGSKCYEQHNPLVEGGQEGVRKSAKWIGDDHPSARGEIKRVFADGDPKKGVHSSHRQLEKGVLKWRRTG
jgi:predicted SnoaL-like aldol condensation-catalyzing enzyme